MRFCGFHELSVCSRKQHIKITSNNSQIMYTTLTPNLSLSVPQILLTTSTIILCLKSRLRLCGWSREIYQNLDWHLSFSCKFIVNKRFLLFVVIFLNKPKLIINLPITRETIWQMKHISCWKWSSINSPKSEGNMRVLSILIETFGRKRNLFS